MNMITLVTLAEFAAFHLHKQAQEIMKDMRSHTLDMPSELVDHDFSDISDWELTMVYKLNGRTLLYGATTRQGKNRGV